MRGFPPGLLDFRAISLAKWRVFNRLRLTSLVFASVFV